MVSYFAYKSLLIKRTVKRSLRFFSFSSSHIHFLINKVYVYILFYSTHILAVFAFSTSQQPMPPKIGSSRCICTHAYAFSLFLFVPLFLFISSSLFQHAFDVTQNSRHDLFGRACSLHIIPSRYILPHVSADICFIVFHVLFEINNTPASVPFFSYFIRRESAAWRGRLVAAFNFTYSRLSIQESNRNGIICFQLFWINRASNI